MQVWNRVADNYQACLEAAQAGYDFSLCQSQADSNYSERLADEAFDALEREDYYNPIYDDQD